MGGGAVIPIDPTFNGGQLVTTPMRNGDDSGQHVQRLSDGKLIVVGVNKSHGSIFVERFDAMGTIDKTFGIDGRALVSGPISATPGGMAVAPDGKIIVAFGHLFYGGALIRLDANGALDGTFGSGGRIDMPDLYSRAIRVQADGKIVVAGGAADPKGENPLRVRRFTASGTLDTTFGTGGTAAIDDPPGSDTGDAIAIDSSGRIIVVGGPFNAVVVRRFTPNGALDTAFNGTGIATANTVNTSSASFGANAIATQDDGKILIGARLNGGSDGVVVRFAASGALDTTFDGDGIASLGTTSSVGSMAIAPSGHMYATSSTALVRLTATGALDTTFAPGGSMPLGFYAHGVHVATDGSVHVTGDDLSTHSTALARVNANGTFDAAFGMAGLVVANMGASADGISTVALQPDGKLIAAGQAIVDTAFSDGWVAARYLPTGELDASFAMGGRLFSTQPKSLLTSSVAIDSTGRFVLTGGFLKCVVAGFTPDGAVDASFGTAGEQVVEYAAGKNGSCSKGVFDASGRLIVVGSANVGAGTFGVARLQPDGTFDPTFAGTGATTTAVGEVSGASSALAIALQSDGKIVAAGRGPTNSGAYGVAVARYLENGTLDTSFDADGKLAMDADADPTTTAEAALGVMQAPDGKYLLVGQAGKPINGSAGLGLGSFIGNKGEFAKLLVVRLLPGGSLDTSFGMSGAVTADFGYQAVIGHALQMRADGNLYVAGQLFDGTTSRGFIARLLENGTVDTTFGDKGMAFVPTNGASGLSSLVSQPDGKLVAGGSAFVNPTGSDFALLRLE